MKVLAPTFQFWFEFGSTYSYLAAARIERVAIAAGIGVEWKPYLLGPIFRAQKWNDSPFNIYPVKGRYMWRDMERLCEKYDIAFRRPTQFPRNGLLAARVAILASQEPWGPEFMRRVFHANFAENLDISDETIIAGIVDAMGLDGGRICAGAQSTGVKEQLRRQTDEAGRLGIFGAPTFVVATEIFWGNDRLDDAMEWYRRLHRRHGT